MIREKYEELCTTPSDINEHLPVLLKYGYECKHITEFGVRQGVSAWAFLESRPKKFVGYDFCRYNGVDDLERNAVSEGIVFEFHQQNVLDADIEPTELLFIDTFHHPLQLKRELEIHNRKVKKYIILHDTETNKLINGSLWPDEIEQMEKSAVKEFMSYPNIGLHPIIIEFLFNHRDWVIQEVFANNNGLTVLKHASR